MRRLLVEQKINAALHAPNAAIRAIEEEIEALLEIAGNLDRKN